VSDGVSVTSQVERDIKELKELMEAMVTANRECSTGCRDSAPHIFGVLKDVGGGDIGSGVEELRETYRYVKRLRKLNDNIGDYITKSVIVILLSGLLAALWAGFKTLATATLRKP